MLRLVLLSVLLSACTFDASVQSTGASDDAAPDATSVLSVDADPLQPDANPTTADASVDANLGPDAGGGIVVFQDGLEGYTGTVDTTIHSMMGDTSFGASTSIKWEDDSVEHGLLRFDNVFGTGANRVPLGAPIVQATLFLTIWDPPNDNGRLIEAAVDWNESTTYNTFGPTAGLQDADLHDESIASLPASMGLQSLDVTESLGRWSNQTRVNQGWALISGSDNDAQCYSKEHTTPTDRPRLEVEYMWP